MHDNIKARLADGLGHAVPEYMEQYIDRADELYRKVGYGNAPWQVIPLLVLLAELDHGKVEEAEPCEGIRRGGLDMRTREGRALKMAGVT